MSASRRFAVALGGTVVAGTTAAVLLAWADDMSWAEAVAAFVPTNLVMGFSFGLCGALIAFHRPGHPVGWLFLADGLGHLASGLAAPLTGILLDQGAPEVAVRLSATIVAYAWPWSIGLFLPLALLLFPDGRPPTPRWRPVLLLVALTAPLFVLANAAEPAPVRPGLPTGYLTLRGHADLSWLWTSAEVRTVGALAVAVLALALRYRRSDEQGRRQLLWLVLAALVVVATLVPWAFLAGTPVGALLVIPLIPVAVTVAIVRERLFDIRLVVSRALTWIVLSLLALALYLSLVGLLAGLVLDATGRSSLAAVAVVVVLAPVLPRLQRGVERMLYGDRREPGLVVSRLGQQLAAGEEPLVAVVEGLRRSLKLPYVAVADAESTLAASGSPSDRTVRLPLSYGGAAVGSLSIGLRAGERELSARDRSVLDALAATVAVALQAVTLTSRLRSSRERIVVAREEERRRLRRDLHDGLGPALTGLALTADAVDNLLGDRDGDVRLLVQSLRRDTRSTLAEVRRVVDGLRSPALEQWGLVEALRRHADGLTRGADGGPLRVAVQAVEPLPVLSAAAEAAAYSIAVEALTNVVRHSGARHASVTIRGGDRAELLVVDDGTAEGPWHPGTGLWSMRERADEVGGHVEAGPSPSGGRVLVTLPREVEP